jgi:hypothetical protein
MPIEPFVYLAVFLFLALLTVFGRWLNEKIREEIDLRDLFGPAEPSEEPQGLQTPETLPPSRQEAITPPSTPLGPRNRRALLKRSLHNTRDLRQGMVLITVLGPCRALEPPPS